MGETSAVVLGAGILDDLAAAGAVVVDHPPPSRLAERLIGTLVSRHGKAGASHA